MKLPTLFLAGMATTATLLFAAPAAHAAVTCPNANPVVDENNCRGPGDSSWKLSNYESGVSGFATETSVDLGSPVALKLSVQGSLFPQTTVALKVYRMGYYGGAGARLVHSATGVNVNHNNACTENATTGRTSCSNWPVTYTIPGSALPASGVYLVKMTTTASSNASYIGGENQIIFTVRNDASHSKLLYQLPISTYQAYNNWGGKSLYTSTSFGANTVAGTPRAVKVSFDRPFSNVLSSFDWFLKTDYGLLYWLERNGYDVTYTDDVADHAAPSRLLDHQAVAISGHDEYWSGEQRTGFEDARAAGVNIANFGSNTSYWKVRYEDPGDRTMVTYKTVEGTGASGALGVNDPGPDGIQGTGPGDPHGVDDALGPDGQAGTADDNPQYATTTWRDNGAPPGDPNAPAAGRVGPDNPENALFGVMYVGDNDSVSYQLRVPAANGANEFAGDSIWRHAPGISPGSATTLPTKAVGWEWDAIPNASQPPYSQYATREPAGVKRLTETNTTADAPAWLQDEGRQYGGSPTTGQPGTTTAVKYTAGSGALVFSSSTMQWSWGLGPHGRDDSASPTETYQDPMVDSSNVNIKQATYNLLSDMDVEPRTPEAGTIVEDADGDLISKADEEAYGSDDNKTDSDSDGVPDNVENANRNDTLDSGETNAADADTDADQIPDGVEDANHNGTLDSGETNPLSTDSDSDQILDGVEDANHNGSVDSGETNPLSADSDSDGIPDGVEDANHNGTVNSGETNPRQADSDSDGIPDGVEDANHNGAVNSGETDPRQADSDSDGIPDGVEDANHNGSVDSGETNPLSTDSDSDGIPDGVEDANHNGTVNSGETNPRSTDSDSDGIPDGVEDANHNGTLDPGETNAAGADTDSDQVPDGVEDANHNGAVNSGETNPRQADSDSDGIPDGVEDSNHNGSVDSGETNPLSADTDSDGIPDGVEDKNHNGVVDSGETNPRKADSDSDGIPDNRDNCGLVPNADQRDFNSDGEGDACDGATQLTLVIRSSRGRALPTIAGDGSYRLKRGAKVQIRGELLPLALAGQRVKVVAKRVRCRRGHCRWVTRWSQKVSVGRLGSFSFKRRIRERGNWRFTGSFAGSRGHRGTSSSSRYVSVR